MGVKITDTTLRDALILTPGPLSRERERGDRQVGVRARQIHSPSASLLQHPARLRMTSMERGKPWA